MWERLSHTLALLTNTTSSKVKFKWTKIEQDTFKVIEQIMACCDLLDYPDFIVEFNIQTDDIKL